jgi:hypothetical protein
MKHVLAAFGVIAWLLAAPAARGGTSKVVSAIRCNVAAAGDLAAAVDYLNGALASLKIDVLPMDHRKAFKRFAIKAPFQVSAPMVYQGTFARHIKQKALIVCVTVTGERAD